MLRYQVTLWVPPTVVGDDILYARTRTNILRRVNPPSALQKKERRLLLYIYTIKLRFYLLVTPPATYTSYSSTDPRKTPLQNP